MGILTFDFNRSPLLDPTLLAPLLAMLLWTRLFQEAVLEAVQYPRNQQPLSQPINQAFSQQGPFHFQEGTQEDQEGPCLKDKEGFQEQEPQSPSCEEGSEGSLHGSQGYH